MVVCKFFLQGKCKFGQNCKYEHQINDNTQNHSTSVMRQSSGGIDTNTLIRSVQNDMLNAEKGGQWLLSSYAPFKDKPAFPGFEDRSFEEVRLGFYEASKSGTVEQYVQQLQTVTKDAVLKTKALQNPSSEAVRLLTQIYNSPVNTGHFSLSQPFSDRNSSNMLMYNSSNFNSNTLGKNIFNQNNQTVFGQPPIFGDTKPTTFSNTGNTTQVSIFSGPVQNNSNIFGGGQKNVFGGSSYSNNIFEQQKNAVFNQAQNSIFGSQQNSTFGQGPVNPYKNQSNNNFIFSSQVNAVNNSPFNSQPNTAVFRVQNPSNSPLANNFIVTQPSSVFNTVSQSLPFNVQQENNLYAGNSSFNVQQSQSSMGFANPHQQDSISMFPVAQQAPLGILGNIPEQKSLNNIFGNPRSASTLSVVNIDETVYSKLENLTETDVKAFQSDHFEFGKIPEKPPTLQMCF